MTVNNSLNRLVGFDRGTLSGGKDSISGNHSREQVWTLDALGNWDNLQNTLGGSGSEDRTHNAQNQITGGVGVTPAYDGNGNMTTNQNGYTLVYDAWNKLVDVRSSTGAGSSIGRYGYDGLGRRITQTPAAAASQFGDTPEPRMNPFNRTTFARVGDLLMFTDVNFRDLYKTDGTVEGTEHVALIGIGSLISQFTPVGSLLFFTWDGALWKSDGTSTGTALVKDINTGGADAVTNLVNVNGTLYFSASNGSNGSELWKSDGTSTGTVMVKDIRSGSNSSSPASLTAVGSTLYFAANDGTNAVELWKSDGTSGGTVLVKDINPGGGAASSSPTNLANMSGTLYFSATNGSDGQELWKSDGTSGGTVQVLDINSGSSGSTPRYFRYVNGTVLFAADDGSHGVELWKTDGTGGNTALVLDINSSGSTSSIFPLDDWAVVGNTLYFVPDDGTHGYELWKSDGTTGGTVMVKDINPGGGNGITHDTVSWFTVTGIDGAIYFRANDGTHGSELWKSDGTSAGTGMFQDIYAGASSSNPRYITKLNDQLFFSGTTAAGIKLWSVDPRVSDLYYTSEWQVAEERINGVMTQQNIFSPVYVDAVILRDRDLDGDGQVDDERLYPMHDANFNVTGVVDAAGDLVERYFNDTYGAPTVLDANWAADGDGVSDVSFVYLHQGGRYDATTKMYHFRRREYDPSLGRWVQVDPMGYVDGANLFEYLSARPIDSLDPWGKSGQKGKPGGGSGGSLGGAKDPSISPTPGQEKGVVIMGEIGQGLVDWAWMLSYNQYVDSLVAKWPKVDTYPNGISLEQFGNVLRDPNVVEIVFIGHGADNDGFGIIWLDLKTAVMASDVKKVLGSSKNIRQVTLRACWQGGSIATREWTEAFGIAPSHFFAPDYNDKWWYKSPKSPDPAPPRPPSTQPSP